MVEEVAVIMADAGHVARPVQRDGLLGRLCDDQPCDGSLMRADEGKERQGRGTADLGGEDGMPFSPGQGHGVPSQHDVVTHDFRHAGILQMDRQLAGRFILRLVLSLFRAAGRQVMRSMCGGRGRARQPGCPFFQPGCGKEGCHHQAADSHDETEPPEGSLFP